MRQAEVLLPMAGTSISLNPPMGAMQIKVLLGTEAPDKMKTKNFTTTTALRQRRFKVPSTPAGPHQEPQSEDANTPH